MILIVSYTIMKYDYLVVGAGLYGAVFAQKAKEQGKTVLVIDKRNNIAGNTVFTVEIGYLTLSMGAGIGASASVDLHFFT